MLGLKRGTVKLVKHNSSWRRSFLEESKKIKKALGLEVAFVEHVGSTSIPEVSAKPVIDIGVAVYSLEKTKKNFKSLEKIGYQLKENDLRKERLFFTKGPEEKRIHYLHIGEKDSGYIEEMILFRDFLRNNPAEAKKYDALKKELVKNYSQNREEYSSRKKKFIEEVVEK